MTYTFRRRTVGEVAIAVAAAAVTIAAVTITVRASPDDQARPAPFGRS